MLGFVIENEDGRGYGSEPALIPGVRVNRSADSAYSMYPSARRRSRVSS